MLRVGLGRLALGWGGMGRSWEPGTPVIRVPGTGREDVACDPACLGVWIAPVVSACMLAVPLSVLNASGMVAACAGSQG